MSAVRTPFRTRIGRRKTPPVSQRSLRRSLSLSQRTMLIEDENDDVEVSLSPMPSRAGNVSPSTICQQRRLSPVVVSATEETHEYAAGRPTVVMPLPPMDQASCKKVSPDLHTSCTLSTTSSISSSTSSKKPPVPSKPPSIPRKVIRSASSDGGRPPSIRRLTSAPIEATDDKFLSLPPPLRLEAWTEPPGTSFNVRGPNYLADKKKVPSEQSAFRLLTVDLVTCEELFMSGLCRHPGERFQKALAREKETGIKELPPFVFAINLAVPGPPNYHIVMYYAVDGIESIRSGTTPFEKLANQFFFGESDTFRDETFKLIPRIVDGNFVVKAAVGSKPSILGNKLRQIYVHDDRFMELIVDIGSNSVAQKVVKLSAGYAKSLIVDMGFVLEANSESTLPERLMGAVRLKNVDFDDRDGKRLCGKA